MSEYNQHNPTSAFLKPQNHIKSLMALQGILKGLVADKKLNEMELLFLGTWIESHSSLPKEGDVLDVVETLNSIVEDGAISVHKLADLQQQINDILEYGAVVPKCVEDLINELLGFVSGISADNVITIEEFRGLFSWLENNPTCIDSWPGNVLHNKLNEILEDGVVDDEELEDLTQTCKMIAGQQFLETGAAAGMATEFCAKPLSAFPNNFETVCFTGKFISGPRSMLNSQANNLGVKPIKNVTQALDILVIGSLANPDWRFTSHGRKIEQALLNQKKGFKTLIITEDNWAALVA